MATRLCCLVNLIRCHRLLFAGTIYKVTHTIHPQRPPTEARGACALIAATYTARTLHNLIVPLKASQAFFRWLFARAIRVKHCWPTNVPVGPTLLWNPDGDDKFQRGKRQAAIVSHTHTHTHTHTQTQTHGHTHLSLIHI